MSDDPWDSADNMKVFFINPQEDLMQVVMAEILGDVIEKNPDFDLADFRIEFDKIKGERALIKMDDWERPWPPVDKDANIIYKTDLPSTTSASNIFWKLF